MSWMWVEHPHGSMSNTLRSSRSSFQSSPLPSLFILLTSALFPWTPELHCRQLSAVCNGMLREVNSLSKSTWPIIPMCHLTTHLRCSNCTDSSIRVHNNTTQSGRSRIEVSMDAGWKLYIWVNYSHAWYMRHILVDTRTNGCWSRRWETEQGLTDNNGSMGPRWRTTTQYSNVECIHHMISSSRTRSRPTPETIDYGGQDLLQRRSAVTIWTLRKKRWMNTVWYAQ